MNGYIDTCRYSGWIELAARGISPIGLKGNLCVVIQAGSKSVNLTKPSWRQDVDGSSQTVGRNGVERGSRRDHGMLNRSWHSFADVATGDPPVAQADEYGD